MELVLYLVHKALLGETAPVRGLEEGLNKQPRVSTTHCANHNSWLPHM